MLGMDAATLLAAARHLENNDRGRLLYRSDDGGNVA